MLDHGSDVLLTLTEVAALLEIATNTINNWRTPPRCEYMDFPHPAHVGRNRTNYWLASEIFKFKRVYTKPLKCEECGRTYKRSITHPTTKTCSPRCRKYRDTKINMRSYYKNKKNQILEVACVQCGVKFTSTHKQRKLCSETCRRLRNLHTMKIKRQRIKICIVCKTAFVPKEGQGRKVCSLACDYKKKRYKRQITMDRELERQRIWRVNNPDKCRAVCRRYWEKRRKKAKLRRAYELMKNLATLEKDLMT